jgi:hypothetical protein
MRALAQGYRVLVCPLPGYAWADLPCANITVTVAGTLTVFGNHVYAAIDTDGGPLCERLFIDPAVLSMNQVAADYAPVRWILGGHSGGATIAPRLAICEDRFSGCYYFSGGMPNEIGPLVGIAEYEQYSLTPAYMRGPAVMDHYRAMLLGGAVAGRHSAPLGGAADGSWLVDTPAKLSLWQECIDSFAAFLRPIGSTFRGLLEPAPAGHDMTQARVDWMFADIATI